LEEAAWSWMPANRQKTISEIERARRIAS